MQTFFDTLESIFFTNIIGSINLYTIVSTLFKFLFVIIILYFVTMICKMLVTDARLMFRAEKMKEKENKNDSDNEEEPTFIIPVLKIIEGINGFKNNEREMRLDKITTIGRSDDNKISLNIPGVSKHHAIIEIVKDGVIIRDLQSTNGVYINNEKLNGVSYLEEGDEIEIASVIFKYLEMEVNS